MNADSSAPDAHDEELMTILGPGDAILTDDHAHGAALCARAAVSGHGFTSRLIGYAPARLLHLEEGRLAKPAPQPRQTRTPS